MPTNNLMTILRMTQAGARRNAPAPKPTQTAAQQAANAETARLLRVFGQTEHPSVVNPAVHPALARIIAAAKSQSAARTAARPAAEGLSQVGGGVHRGTPLWGGFLGGGLVASAPAVATGVQITPRQTQRTEQRAYAPLPSEARQGATATRPFAPFASPPQQEGGGLTGPISPALTGVDRSRVDAMMAGMLGLRPPPVALPENIKIAYDRLMNELLPSERARQDWARRLRGGEVGVGDLSPLPAVSDSPITREDTQVSLDEMRDRFSRSVGAYIDEYETVATLDATAQDVNDKLAQVRAALIPYQRLEIERVDTSMDPQKAGIAALVTVLAPALLGVRPEYAGAALQQFIAGHTAQKTALQEAAIRNYQVLKDNRDALLTQQALLTNAKITMASQRADAATRLTTAANDMRLRTGTAILEAELAGLQNDTARLNIYARSHSERQQLAHDIARMDLEAVMYVVRHTVGADQRRHILRSMYRGGGPLTPEMLERFALIDVADTEADAEVQRLKSNALSAFAGHAMQAISTRLQLHSTQLGAMGQIMDAELRIAEENRRMQAAGQAAAAEVPGPVTAVRNQVGKTQDAISKWLPYNESAPRAPKEQEQMVNARRLARAAIISLGQELERFSLGRRGDDWFRAIAGALRATPIQGEGETDAAFARRSNEVFAGQIKAVDYLSMAFAMYDQDWTDPAAVREFNAHVKAAQSALGIRVEQQGLGRTRDGGGF